MKPKAYYNHDHIWQKHRDKGDFVWGSKSEITYNQIMEKLQQLLAQGSHVVDAGCGAGRLAKFVSDHGHSYTGIDESAVAIAMAEQRFSQDEIKFLQGDLAGPAKILQNCDAVTSVNVLHCLVEPSCRQNFWNHLKAWRPRFVFLTTMCGPYVPLQPLKSPRAFVASEAIEQEWQSVGFETMEMTVLPPNQWNPIPNLHALLKR